MEHNGSPSRGNSAETLRNMRQQIAVANAQRMLEKITVNCFKKCIDKPGTSLTRAEERCVVQCMDRFMDSIKLVSLAYSRRLIREHAKS